MLESQSPQAGGRGAGSVRQQMERRRQREGCPEGVTLQGNALGMVAFLCQWAEDDTVPSGHLDF